jgi:hypothetical protein
MWGFSARIMKLGHQSIFIVRESALHHYDGFGPTSPPNFQALAWCCHGKGQCNKDQDSGDDIPQWVHPIF